MSTTDAELFDKYEERAVWERLCLLKGDFMNDRARVKKSWHQMHFLLVRHLTEFHECTFDGCEYHSEDIPVSEPEQAYVDSGAGLRDACTKWGCGPRISCDCMKGWESTRRSKNRQAAPQRKKANDLLEVNLFMDHGSAHNRIGHTRILHKFKDLVLREWSRVRERYEDEAWSVERARKQFYELARRFRVRA